jgi:hypothetical protein
VRFADEPSSSMALFDEITDLLAAPVSGDGAPELADVEHTLTTGYARALALEAERFRLERRLGELRASAGEGRELDSVLQRLADAACELKHLRSMLEPLRSRATLLRTAC